MRKMVRITVMAPRAVQDIRTSGLTCPVNERGPRAETFRKTPPEKGARRRGDRMAHWASAWARASD